MTGYTQNSILVYGDPEKIFDITNDVSNWANIFTEYEDVDILEKKGDYVKFLLKTRLDENGKSKQWISERTVDRRNLTVRAKRLDPAFPFIYMNINWEYEVLPHNSGVLMTWIQDFEVDPNCQHDTYDMESYLNRSTRAQMKAVKNSVEKLLSSNK